MKRVLKIAGPRQVSEDSSGREYYCPYARSLVRVTYEFFDTCSCPSAPALTLNTAPIPPIRHGGEPPC
jgi:hypothetical protein